MKAEFHNTFTHGRIITQVAHFDLPGSLHDAYLGHFVLETTKPDLIGAMTFGRFVRDQFEHRKIVA